MAVVMTFGWAGQLAAVVQLWGRVVNRVEKWRATRLTGIDGLFWLNFSAIDTYIEDNLHISAFSTGLLALVFHLTYVLLSLPSGMIIDKKGFKYSIGIGVIFTGIFSMIRIIDPYSYPLLLISQIGISIGQPTGTEL